MSERIEVREGSDLSERPDLIQWIVMTKGTEAVEETELNERAELPEGTELTEKSEVVELIIDVFNRTAHLHDCWG